MIYDLINLDKLRRAIIYALFMLVIMFFQTTVFSGIAPLGVRAMFLPVAVVSVGMFEGGTWGGFFGLFLGLLGDVAYTENVVLFTVLFPILGFFSGLVAEFFVNRRFFSFFFVCVTALLITAFCQMFRLLVFAGAEPLALVKTALLQTLWSLPFTVPLYFPCKALSRRKLG